MPPHTPRRAALVALLCLAGRLGAQSSDAAPSRWTPVGTTKANVRWELDLKSVTTIDYFGHQVKSVWLRTTYPSPITAGKIKGINYTLQVSYYDCAERKSAVMRVIAYRAANDSTLGDEDRTNSAPSLQSVVPGSLDETVLLMACATGP